MHITSSIGAVCIALAWQIAPIYCYKLFILKLQNEKRTEK